MPLTAADCRNQVTLASKIRLTTRRVARLAVEGGGADGLEVAALYHSAQNTRIYRERDEPDKIDFAIEAAPALEHVLASYPKFVSVAKLPCDSDAQRLDVARALAEVGCVLVKTGES